MALYELANENSELDTIEKNVHEILAIFNASEDFKNFIKNPTQSQSNQLETFNKISSQMSLSKTTIDFISVLINKRRISFINQIFIKFLSLVSKQKGELKALLTSSKNLSSVELENIKKDLSSAMGTSIAIEYKVEESLIGGLKMQIGSLMIDTSIKNKLKKYKQTMLETQYAN